MNSVFDLLFLRRPKIEYVSPPVCDFIFSSSGAPIIVLNDITKRRGPSGLILGGEGNVRLSWDAYPGALCYSIYRVESGMYILVAECITDTFYDLSVPGDYSVTVITKDGESDFSETISFGGSGSCVPLAWWAFEDADFSTEVIDSVYSIPLELVYFNFGGASLPPAPQTYLGKVGYALPNYRDILAVGQQFSLITNAVSSLGAVNLASGCTLNFNVCHVDLGAPNLVNQAQTVHHILLKDAGSNFLGSVWVFVNDFGYAGGSGFLDPYPLDQSQTVANDIDATNDGIRVVVQDALGAILVNELHPVVPGKQSTQTVPASYEAVAVVYDAAAGQVKVYVENVLVLTTAAFVPIAGVCASSEYTFQTYATFPNTTFTGIWMDELSVWPCALNQADITALYGHTWPL